MKAICASVNLDLFMVLPRPTARLAHAAKLEFSSKDRSENREADHQGGLQWQGSDTSLKRSLRSCGRSTFWSRRARTWWTQSATAAKIGGMDRQTLRDWVIRFNEQAADGLINIPSPGIPPKLNAIHKAFLARIVEEGPIAAIHGVVRWRACDLIMRLYEAFGLSVSDDTIYRALKNLGFSHVSARPKAYK